MLCESVNVDSNGKDEDDDGGESIDETDFYAWNELRLHLSLMKSIYRLGFKEPTPIQKACIPAAAHQGKVSRVNVSDKVIFCGKAYLWTVLFFQVVIVMFLCDRMLLVLQRLVLERHLLLVCPSSNDFWRKDIRPQKCLKSWVVKLKSLPQNALCGH